jgi:hypothetical protein
MRLVGMDKKMFVVQHTMTNEELDGFKDKPAELNKIVGQGIFNRVVQTLSQTTKVKQFKSDKGMLWNYAMWIYSDQDFWTLIKEICEMSEEDRQKLLLDANEMLGIFTDMENKKE